MKLRTDLPIKYHVGAHRLCASYPDETDVIYDIVQFTISSNKRKKTWKHGDFKIAMSSLKDVFPSIGDDNFKDKVKTILLALHKNNYISIVDGENAEDKNIILTQDGFNKLYENQA